jgi:hypothetical protein
VGIGLCDVLLRYVIKTTKTSSFDVREPRFSEFRTLAIPVLMPWFFCHHTDHSQLSNAFYFRYVRFAAFVPYGMKLSFSQSLFISPTDALYICLVKGKGLPQQAEVVQGVPDRLRPRIFLTFGTTRVVDRQPYAPAAFTPGEIPGTHF